MPMVDLQPKRPHWEPPRSRRVNLRRSLPFYRSKNGVYVHRVRSAAVYFWDGKASHTSVNLWCGQGGFISGKKITGSLYESAPTGAVICATCEGRARGAGQALPPTIHGRAVKFSPRPN